MSMKADEPVKMKSLEPQVMLAQVDKKHRVVDSMSMKADEPIIVKSLDPQVMLA